MIHMLLKMKLDLTKFKCCLVFYPNHDRHALKPRQNMAYFCFYLKVHSYFPHPFLYRVYSVLFISVSGTYNLLWEMILNCIISPPLMMGEVFVGLSDYPIYQPPSGFSLIVMITAQWFITKEVDFSLCLLCLPLV